jgi:prepilin-type N-terminal cleavage/methylation domain-containing protein
MKMLKLLRRKGGMTLVELIVTLVIAAIIIALSGTYLISGTNLFNHVASKNLDEDIAQTAVLFAIEDMNIATAITARTPAPADAAQRAGTPSGSALLYIGNEAGIPSATGMLFYSRPNDVPPAINVFGKGFYHGRSISLTYHVDRVDEAASLKSVTVSITVFSGDGRRLITRSKSVRMLNAVPPGRTDPPTHRPPLDADAGKTYPQASAIGHAFPSEIGSLLLELDIPADDAFFAE